MMRDIFICWVQFLLTRVRIFLAEYPVHLPSLRSTGSSNRDKFRG